jgi:hypothetical protein
MMNDSFDDIIFNDLDDEQEDLLKLKYQYEQEELNEWQEYAASMYNGAEYNQDGSIKYLKYCYDMKLFRCKTSEQFIKLIKLKAFW